MYRSIASMICVVLIAAPAVFAQVSTNPWNIDHQFGGGSMTNHVTQNSGAMMQTGGQYVPVNLPDNVLPSGAVRSNPAMPSYVGTQHPAMGAPASPTSLAGKVKQAGHQILSHVGVGGNGGRSSGQACGCGTCGACVAGGSIGNVPPALYMPNPPQSGTFTSGACEPCILGVDCADNCGGAGQTWKDSLPMNFSPLRQGGYLGPVRLPAVTEYRVRAGDQIDFIYSLTREEIADDYRIQIGDEFLLESTTDENLLTGTLERGLEVQADGNLHLRLVGPVRAAGLTYRKLRSDIEKTYKRFLKDPAINVIPVKSNTRLQDLQATVDNRFGNGGLGQLTMVNPDGRINLPKIGSVYVQGLTLEEVKREVNLRYRDVIFGVEVEPQLAQIAPKFIYVFGEVAEPGQFDISDGPITVTQGLALAGGINVGGNHREVVVFRRAEDWRLVATMLDLRGAHLGRTPDPSDQIFLQDGDLIIVPPMPILLFDNFVSQVFVDGIYGIVPFGGFSFNFDDDN